MLQHISVPIALLIISKKLSLLNNKYRVRIPSHRFDECLLFIFIYVQENRGDFDSTPDTVRTFIFDAFLQHQLDNRNVWGVFFGPTEIPELGHICYHRCTNSGPWRSGLDLERFWGITCGHLSSDFKTRRFGLQSRRLCNAGTQASLVIGVTNLCFRGSVYRTVVLWRTLDTVQSRLIARRVISRFLPICACFMVTWTERDHALLCVRSFIH